MNAFVAKIGGFVNKRSTGILAGAGIGGFFLAGYEAIKVTPACNLAIDNAVIEKGGDLTLKEKIKIYGKHYWKSIVIALISAAAVIASVKVGAKKRALLEAALAVTTNALSSQSEKIVEKYGKDALDAIQSSIAKDRVVKRITVNDEEPEIVEHDGEIDPNAEVVYHDAWTGYEFVSTPSRLLEAWANANEKLKNEDCISINDYFDCIPTRKYEGEEYPRKVGDIYGWTTERAPKGINYYISSSFHSGGKLHIIMKWDIDPLERVGRI